MRKASGASGAGGGGKTSRRTLAVWALLSLVAAIFAPSMMGATHTAYADVPVVAGGKAIVANTDGDPIRIRKGAGTDYAQIAVAREGQTVNVLDGPVTDRVEIRWFKVQAPGGTGWMMAQYLRGTTAPGTASETKLTGSARVANTDGDRLRVRSSPSTSGTVVTRIEPGTIVAIEAGPVTDDTGITWYRIRSGSVTGWAMARYLVQAETAAPPDEGRETPTEAEPTSSRSGGTSNPSQYRQWMEEARAMYPYPQSVDKMWGVMQCESGGNPNASGGGGRWLGLFQYAPGTWGGSWNPYRANSIWDAKSQIFATAKAWSIGMQNHWSCY